MGDVPLDDDHVDLALAVGVLPGERLVILGGPFADGVAEGGLRKGREGPPAHGIQRRDHQPPIAHAVGVPGLHEAHVRDALEGQRGQCARDVIIGLGEKVGHVPLVLFQSHRPDRPVQALQGCRQEPAHADRPKLQVDLHPLRQDVVDQRRPAQRFRRHARRLHRLQAPEQALAALEVHRSDPLDHAADVALPEGRKGDVGDHEVRRDVGQRLVAGTLQLHRISHRAIDTKTHLPLPDFQKPTRKVHKAVPNGTILLVAAHQGRLQRGAPLHHQVQQLAVAVPAARAPLNQGHHHGRRRLDQPVVLGRVHDLRRKLAHLRPGPLYRPNGHQQFARHRKDGRSVGEHLRRRHPRRLQTGVTRLHSTKPRPLLLQPPRRHRQQLAPRAHLVRQRPPQDPHHGGGDSRGPRLRP